MLDICIRNGAVLDGSGREAVVQDVGIVGGTIAALGRLRDTPARRTIDAAGLTVCPGFLDLHRHADATVFQEDFGEGELLQGLTTVGNGNCGLSLAPRFGSHASAIARYLAPVTGAVDGIAAESLTAYRHALAARPMPLHALMLAGGGTVRACVAGFQKTRLDEEDIRAIQALLERTLAEGAKGVSLGLGYAPECFYTTEELIRVLAPLRHTATVLSVHMREEAMRLLPSIEEVLTVARALDVPLQISHLKATGKENWGRLAQQALARLERAREEGLDVMCDVYPYTAGSTQLLHILPPEFLQGGPQAVTARLKDPTQRRALLRRLAHGTDFDNYARLVGWENIRVAAVRNGADAVYIGRSIAEAAGDGDPGAFALDLLARSECEVTMIDALTTEADIAAILQSPLSYAISDATYPTGGRLHPRVYGACSTVIETYVNRRRALTLPQAVRKMTRCPADRYGLKGKGRIAVGADADILVFDPQRVRTRATYENPRQGSEGMEYVLVGGQLAVERGKRTAACGGTVI